MNIDRLLTLKDIEDMSVNNSTDLQWLHEFCNMLGIISSDPEIELNAFEIEPNPLHDVASSQVGFRVKRNHVEDPVGIFEDKPTFQKDLKITDSNAIGEASELNIFYEQAQVSRPSAKSFAHNIPGCFTFTPDLSFRSSRKKRKMNEEEKARKKDLEGKTCFPCLSGKKGCDLETPCRSCLSILKRVENNPLQDYNMNPWQKVDYCFRLWDAELCQSVLTNDSDVLENPMACPKSITYEWLYGRESFHFDGKSLIRRRRKFITSFRATLEALPVSLNKIRKFLPTDIEQSGVNEREPYQKIYKDVFDIASALFTDFFKGSLVLKDPQPLALLLNSLITIAQGILAYTALRVTCTLRGEIFVINPCLNIRQSVGMYRTANALLKVLQSAKAFFEHKTNFATPNQFQPRMIPSLRGFTVEEAPCYGELDYSNLWSWSRSRFRELWRRKGCRYEEYTQHMHYNHLVRKRLSSHNIIHALDLAGYKSKPR